MKKIIYKLTFLWCFIGSITMLAQQQNFLSVSGNKLIDSRGEEVRLTGVNWFGFETQNYFPHGIWTRDMKSVLQQIKDLGFNTIRVPWCNEMLNPEATITIPSYGTDAYTGISPMNEVETNITKPIELLDVFVQWCQENDMKIVLDNHSREADGFLNEAFWYTDTYSEERWINDWIFMADRYKDFSAVVAMDLNNEPHGSSWGNSNPATDWNKAAERCGNAVLNVNPNVVIIVEGVGEFEGNSYWWGGQLMGARQYPVQLSNPSKLMYSAHEYGPEVSDQDWFNTSDFPQNMPEIWEANYDYLYQEGTSPLFVGEFGIKNQDAFGGIAFTWFTEFTKFMGNRYSWTFWSMNPNSGDTGGILQDDWSSVNQWKLDVLRPYFAPLIPNVIGGIGNTNQSPIVEFTVSETSGEPPFAITLDASNSSDPDGDVLTYSWDFGDGNNANGITTSHVYTQVGSYTIKLTVSDGDKQAIANKIIIVKDETTTTGCTFNTPTSEPLPSINKSYANIFVLGNGPDLSNVTDVTINWNLTNNGLYQFSMNTNNGSPSWWNDFLPNVTQNFNQAQPEVTIVASGFAGLDGDYWVTIDGDNFVLVSKTGNFTIYFSTTDDRPNCISALSKKRVPLAKNNVAINSFKIGPNPVTDFIHVMLPQNVLLGNKFNGVARLLNINGQVVRKEVFKEQLRLQIPVTNLAKGLYFLEIKDTSSGVNVIKKMVVK